MADNTTSLIVEVQTKGVQQAASDLQKLANAGSSAEQSTGGMASAIDRVNAQMRAMGDKAKAASQSFNAFNPAAQAIGNVAKESEKAAQSIPRMATGISAVNAQLAAMGAKAQGAGNAFRALDPAAQNMAKLAREAKEAEKAVKQAAIAIEKASKSSEGFGTSSVAIAKGGVAAFAIIKAWEMVAANIGKAIDAADEYTRIESRLRQVSGGASGAAELQKELYTVAQESRQSFTELANTYAQVARSTEELGISQGELLNITKAVSQAVTISGASTQAANAAMIQFSQAMASGVLRGEELRSVMEQTPRLARAIAQGLGVGIGELRKLGEQGELTAQKVLGAIAKSAGDIDREFKSMTPTVADGFTKLGNSAKNFIDVLNDATGASKALYKVLNALSGAMDFTAKNVATGVQNAKTGVLEAEIGRLKNQIGSLGKGDFRLSGLQSQLDAKQSELFKARGSSLAGGAEMPVLQNPAAKGPSADYLALTQKMSGVSQDFHKHLKILNAEYGRTGNLKNYQAEVKKLIETETQIGKDSAKKPKSGGGGRSVGRESDEAKAYEQALKAIASAKLSAEKSTLSLTAAESALFDLQKSPVWASMPETWKQTAIEQSKAAAEYERTAMFMKAVEAQEQSNVKQRQGMIEQIQAAEKANEMYGLTASQISVVEQSRLADAIAILEQEAAIQVLNGASEEEKRVTDERIKFLKEELSLRGKLSDVLISGDVKKYDIEDAANSIKDSTKELDEFTKQAARNMQDAMADFFINPTKDGMDSLVESFGKTIQKMIVQAGSAQLMNILFGDMGKTGKVSGLAGDGLDWLKKAFGGFSFGVPGGMSSPGWGGGWFANGGAFDGGATVKKFANGGAFGNGSILTRPTMFAMGGTFGVAGEAGPEGALPLKRMSNGKLGVHMSGGGGMTINQTINAGAGTDKAEVRRAAASGARSVLGVANGARRYG